MNSTNPALLLDAIVASLKSIREFADVVGDDVSAYPNETTTARSLAEVVQEMGVPSALVAFRGMAPGERGGFPQFKYSFVVILRAESELDTAGPGTGYFSLLDAILQGEPTNAGGVLFINAEIHPDYDPPEDVAFVPGSDANGTEFWQFNFSLMRKGG
jgi:hypothetical protein